MSWFKKGASRFSHIKKVKHAGIQFDSKLEHSVYELLLQRQAAGEFKSIQCQDVVYLTLARIRYEPDFKCIDQDDTPVWVEAKGYANERWPMKKKLWKFYGPGKLEIWKGTHARPLLDEVIIPKGGENGN